MIGALETTVSMVNHRLLSLPRKLHSFERSFTICGLLQMDEVILGICLRKILPSVLRSSALLP